MRWTVTYRPSAKYDHADIWLNSSQRQAVTDAADEIEKLLAGDPLHVGESRTGNSRILIRRPLAVQFDVYADDYRVVVWEVVPFG